MSEIEKLKRTIDGHLDSGKRVKIYLCKDFDQAFDAISVTSVSICSDNFFNVESGELSHLVNMKFITNVTVFND